MKHLQIAGTATLPFDVVKTHKQIELGEIDFAVKGDKLYLDFI